MTTLHVATRTDRRHEEAPRVPTTSPSTRPDETILRRRRRLARLALMWATLSLLSEATPLGYWLDDTLSNRVYATTWLVTGLPSVTFAVLLVAVSSGLRRGRNSALWLFVGCAAATGPIALLLGTAATTGSWSSPPWFWCAVAAHAALLVAIAAQHRSFHVTSDRVARRRLWALLPVCGLALAGGVLLVTATDTGHVSTLRRIGYVLQHAVADMGLWSWTSRVSVPWWVNLVVNVTAALLVLAVLYLLLRPKRRPSALGAEDEARLRALLVKQGARDSLAYFALRRDKNAVFSTSGKAAVTYRVVNGVSLASADPIGDVEAWPGAIAAWQAEAAEHGWRLGVLGASEQGATVYRREAGLTALALGDEAVVDTASFDLQGRPMRTVRQACARLERAGYSTTVARQQDLDADIAQQVAAAADGWREGGPERGFSMALSRLGDAADPRYVVMRCHDADGRLRALLGFVPWGEDGLSLDLMRRDRDADNGLFEFMITDLFRWAAEHGVRRVSLNFAMFREVFANGTRIGAGPVLRLQCRVLMIASRWWQLESLYRANRKYQPAWHPRFVCFERAGDLAAVAVAAGRAEGFLP